MKLCSKCKEIKPLTEYHLDRSKKKGVRSSCKICMNITNKKGLKENFNLLMTDRYRHQVFNSKARNHPLPSYSLESFLVWVNNQSHSRQLFKQWQESNYSKKLAPSVDRINSLLPYTLDNIVLTTWEVNNKNNHKDQANGINNSNSHPIASFDEQGQLISKYHSITHASKETNISYWKVRNALLNPETSYNGLMWRYL